MNEGKSVFAKYITEPKKERREIERMQMGSPAQMLRDWLLTHWDKPSVAARDIQRFGPNSIRDRETAINLAEILVKDGWLVPLRSHRHDRHEWQIIRGSNQRAQGSTQPSPPPIPPITPTESASA